MLMRATQDGDIDSGRNDDTQRIGDIIKDYN
jgi:hypothetical protein